VRRRGRIAAVGLSGRPSIDVRWDFATTRDADVAFAMSSHYEAWEPALSILERVAPDAAALPTVFGLTEWAAAFDAVEQRAVIKAVIDPSEAHVDDA
jgi:threonine dehydrogenase-like Zn-dependent dehydrogenase